MSPSSALNLLEMRKIWIDFCSVWLSVSFSMLPSIYLPTYQGMYLPTLYINLTHKKNPTIFRYTMDLVVNNNFTSACPFLVSLPHDMCTYLEQSTVAWLL